MTGYPLTARNASRARRAASLLTVAPVAVALLGGSLFAAQGASSAEAGGAIVSGQAIEQALREKPTAPEPAPQQRSLDRGLHVGTDRGIHVVPVAANSGAGSSEKKDAQESRPSIDLNIPFQFNSSELQPQAAAQLSQLQLALNSAALSKNRFMIAGHTDAVGSATYNQQLSERRAAAVKQFLVGRGVAAVRLDAVGYGSARLLLPDKPEDPGNRRVEIRNLGD